jgi:hypothetical protein
MKRAFFAAIVGVLLLTLGCKQQHTVQDYTPAFRDAVVKYLSTRAGLAMNNMDIAVTKSTVDGDKAQADVEIRAKNSDPGSPAMRITYELQKQGNEWVVVKSQSNGGMQHPDPGAMTQQSELPEGHPPTTGAAPGTPSGNAPANHPDFNSILDTAKPAAQPQPQQGTQQPSNAKP